MDDTILYASVPVPTPEAMLRRESFGGMLAGGNMAILNLNADAVAIWELFDSQRSVADIEALLLKEYEAQHVRATLLEFVRYCLHAGCITLRL